MSNGMRDTYGAPGCCAACRSTEHGDSFAVACVRRTQSPTDKKVAETANAQLMDAGGCGDQLSTVY